ncbi:hypothetical protein EVAR_38565_1 [Eumeta japonica]|uniref:RNA-directed DNA polymerase from mobile element jockey n=1 Tax=Eumeta variegata TaxID=151549 RepID=A0A4C1WSU0_EUMVA|nr:hypothetical protein EVAR_38565_1 [Eumeta japonica]
MEIFLLRKKVIRKTREAAEFMLGRCISKKTCPSASGIDGFISDIRQVAIFGDLGLFLVMANVCLELGYAPRPWNVAAIKVIPTMPVRGPTVPKVAIYPRGVYALLPFTKPLPNRFPIFPHFPPGIPHPSAPTHVAVNSIFSPKSWRKLSWELRLVKNAMSQSLPPGIGHNPAISEGVFCPPLRREVILQLAVSALNAIGGARPASFFTVLHSTESRPMDRQFLQNYVWMVISVSLPFDFRMIRIGGIDQVTREKGLFRESCRLVPT